MEELYASENNASVYAENSDRHRVRDEDAQELSVEKSVLSKLFDHYFFQCVWKKAPRLLSEPQSILKAPSKDSKIKAFSVLSESTNVPNYVQIHGNAKVTCTCKQFPPKKICSHSVAVAEKEDMLKHFIDWLLKANSSSNITLTATMNLNTSRSGRKGGISKRKRCATQPVTAVIDPFSGEVTSATQHTTQPVTVLPSTNLLQQAFPVATQRLSCNFPVHSPNPQNQGAEWHSVQLQNQHRQESRAQQANIFQRNIVPQNNQSQHPIWQPYLNVTQSRTNTSRTATALGNSGQPDLLKPVPPGIHYHQSRQCLNRIIPIFSHK